MSYNPLDLIRNSMVSEEQEEAERLAQRQFLNDPSYTVSPATPDEMLADLKGSPADSLLANPIKEFGRMQFILLSTPAFIISLQGLRQLTTLDSPMEPEEAFSRANFRPLYYRGLDKLDQHQQANLSSLTLKAQQEKAKFYTDKEWHRNFIATLAATGIPLDPAKVASRTNMLGQIAAHLSKAKEFIEANGWTSLAEAKTASGLDGYKPSAEELAAALQNEI